MLQSTVSCLQNTHQQQHLPYHFLHRNFDGWNSPKTAQVIEFSFSSNLNFARTTTYVSSINVSVDVVVPVHCYSIVQYCVWFPGKETWFGQIVKKCRFVWAVLINRLDFSQNNLVDFCYHGLNKTSICRTMFNDNDPGKGDCIPNFMDR